MLITGRLAHDLYWLKCMARLPLFLPSTKVGLLTSLKYENKNILFRSIRSAVNTAFPASWLVKMGTRELGELLRQGRTRRYINCFLCNVRYVFVRTVQLPVPENAKIWKKKMREWIKKFRFLTQEIFCDYEKCWSVMNLCMVSRRGEKKIKPNAYFNSCLHFIFFIFLSATERHRIRWRGSCRFLQLMEAWPEQTWSEGSNQ